jgi:hypothetical protein
MARAGGPTAKQTIDQLSVTLSEVKRAVEDAQREQFECRVRAAALLAVARGAAESAAHRRRFGGSAGDPAAVDAASLEHLLSAAGGEAAIKTVAEPVIARIPHVAGGQPLLRLER